MLTVAAIQLVSSDNVPSNLQAAEQLIAKAASKNATLVVLPENFAFMGASDVDRLAIKEVYGAGHIQSFLSAKAKQHAIWLLGGTIPLACEGKDRIHAASLLYDPMGTCLAHYNKIHLFDVAVNDSMDECYMESNTFLAGHDLVVAQTDFARIGLSVCYDLRFPELYRNLLNQGMQIITVPAAFTKTTGEAHWLSLIKTRAIENLAYVIAANQGGMHGNGRATWGHSMIVDPWGAVLAELDKGEGLVIADIDLDAQRRLRDRFPVLKHRKLDYKI